MNRYDKEHLRKVAEVQKLIDAIYDEAIKEAAALGVTINMPSDAENPFSFDDYPLTQKRVDELLENLRSNLHIAIVNAVNSAWTLSNNKNNELCNMVFGANARRLPPDQYKKYYSNNDDARQAFLERKTRGMNLSDRVWHYTDLFRREIEMGIDLGIRDGRDAASMARDLKQYLRHPDKLFRRVRDEHGILHLSKNAAAFHPGAGVYRSSYMNARRLAATETNMAYRTADHKRWEKMDMVVGQEIHLSSNHTCLGRDGKPHKFTDICDQLKGRYPKDFKFVGWHPHCRCYVTSILKTKEEMKEDVRKILRGEPIGNDSENKVTDVPKGFKDWLDTNGERIMNAKSLPYFLRDNGKMTDDGYVLNVGNAPVVKAPPTIQERAAQRHAARTEEEANKIRHQWQYRQIGNLADDVMEGRLPNGVMKRLLDIKKQINNGEHDEAASRISLLQRAAQRHAQRTPAQIRDIQDKADERRYGKEYVENVHKIEEALGMKRGKRMNHQDADTGRVNPDFGKRGYKTNCSTCSATYILRRMGFDVEAKANTSRNDKVRALSLGYTWDKWIDGKTSYHSTKQWMADNGVTAMDSASYQNFLDEYTKETGIYEFNVGYKPYGNNGHSTLLERKADGTLVRIEQQVIRSSATLDNLLPSLSATPPDVRGVMRVDDARFNPYYASAVRKVKKKK